MLSSTTFKEEFDSGLTKTGSKKINLEQNFFLETDVDFSLKSGFSEDVDDWDLSMYSQPNFYSLETTLNFNFFFSIWTEYSCADGIFPKRAKSYIELTVITFYFHMGIEWHSQIAFI